MKAGGLSNADCVWADNNISQYETFGEFVKNWLTRDNIYSYYHFRPQFDFVAIRGKLAVDFIGRYENIETDYNVIRDRLKTGSELRPLNTTKARNQPYCAYYDRETIEIVAGIYRQDLAAFGYNSDGPVD